MRNRRNKRVSRNNKKSKTTVNTKKTVTIGINNIDISNNLKITIILCLFLGLFFISTIFSLLNMTNTKIINGIKIEKVDVSGLTRRRGKRKTSKMV